MTDRRDLVRHVLDLDMGPGKRRTLCACIGLADDDLVFPWDTRLIAPMSGNRRGFVVECLRELVEEKWITIEVQGSFEPALGRVNHQDPCQ